MSNKEMKHMIREDEEEAGLEKLPIRINLELTWEEEERLRSLRAWEEASPAGMAHYVFGKGWKSPEDRLADEVAYKQKYDEVMGRGG